MYYVHAHQVMVLNKFGERRKLGTKTLVEKLWRKYGDAYNPKLNYGEANYINSGRTPISRQIQHPQIPPQPLQDSMGLPMSYTPGCSPHNPDHHCKGTELKDATTVTTRYHSPSICNTPQINNPSNPTPLQWQQLWNNQQICSPLVWPIVPNWVQPSKTGAISKLKPK